MTYLASETIAALGWTDRSYSYARNNISDLGIPEISRLHAVMNTGFVVDGALFVLAGLGLSVLFEGRARWIVATTSVVHGVGSIIVGLAHASVDGASTPHAAGAGMAIIGGNLVLLAAGRYGGRVGAPRWYTVGSALGGVLGLVGFGLFLANTGILGGGTFERISVYTIIGWEIITGATILARCRLAEPR
ncbi:Conserved membrane protein [Rhodococcus sp. AW25M09]|nr:Conserved membrane protein [Rhodococcus sp. AW25M09]